ncbi:TetR/AcrR family transcriptional regulator [Phenylobacterium sp.]|uniref:TetR/AcrR family transcriptional regulator n=1 Tax=Phenylobacterium sp. TaxID=1871053 RepID=UPI003BA9F4EC
MSQTTTRQKVVDAALTLFTEQGYDQTSLAQVGRLSGVSHGSIFHHFGSKDGVGIEVYLLERRTYWEAAVTALEGGHADPVQAIGAAIRATLRYQQAHPQRHNFMIECASADWMSRHSEPVRALNAEFEARFVAWASPWLAAGKLPLAPPEVFAALVFGSTQWIARSWLTGLTDDPPTRYEDALVALVSRCFTMP